MGHSDAALEQISVQGMIFSFAFVLILLGLLLCTLFILLFCGGVI